MAWLFVVAVVVGGDGLTVLGLSCVSAFAVVVVVVDVAVVVGVDGLTVLRLSCV